MLFKKNNNLYLFLGKYQKKRVLFWISFSIFKVFFSNGKTTFSIQGYEPDTVPTLMEQKARANRRTLNGASRLRRALEKWRGPRGGERLADNLGPLGVGSRKEDDNTAGTGTVEAQPKDEEECGELGERDNIPKMSRARWEGVWIIRGPNHSKNLGMILRAWGSRGEIVCRRVE